MFDLVEDVTQLCRDWPHLDKSFEKYAIAAVAIPVLLVGFVNLPWILFCVFTWLLVSRFYLSVLLVARTISSSIPFLSKARPSQRLLTGRGSSVSGLRGEEKTMKLKSIPGRTGLSFIGETVSFLANSRQFLLDRQRRFGNIFQTSIDFSGTFLAARRVVCLFPSTAGSQCTQSTQPAQSTVQAATPRTLSDPVNARGRSHLKYIGYSGLYGSSHAVKQHVPILAERVLNEARNLDRWEDVATPIIQTFLRRLIFESNFSFADRVNELACEVVSAVFLNIPGYSPALQQSLDRYLTTSQHNPSFNASLKDRKQISNCIHVAAYEEDRRYFSRDWQDFDADSAQQHQQYGGDVLSPGNGSGGQYEAVLSELLEHCTEVLKQSKLAARTVATTNAASAGATAGTPRRHQLSTTLNTAESGSHSTPAEEISTEVTAKEAHDLLFIFLVEVVYSTLVQQLRSLVQYIVVNQDNACAQARNNYKAYLTARQLVGNVSGTGLARFSWASTLKPDEEPGPEGYEQEDHPEQGAAQHDYDAIASDVQQSSNVTGSTDEEPEYYPHSTIGSYLLSHIWQPSPSPTPSKPDATKKSGGAAQQGTPQRPLCSPPPSPIPSSGSSMRQLPAPRAFPVSPDADVDISADAEGDHDDLNYSCSTASTTITATSVGRDGIGMYAVATTTAAVCTVTTETTGTVSSSTTVPRRYTDQRPPYIATTPTRSAKVGAISATSPQPFQQYTPTSRTQPGSGSLPSSTTSSAGRRYSGKYGPRKTPQKTPQRAGQKFSADSTPSRSVLRSAGNADTRDFPSPMHDRSLLRIGGGFGLGGGDGIALGDVSMGGNGSNVGSVSKNDWKYREMLIIQYITSIKELVWNAKASTVLVPLPLQYSLHLCTQTHDLRDEQVASSTSAEKVQYSIHKDDLVIQVHGGAGAGTSAASASTSGARSGSIISPVSQSPRAEPAHHDLGLFSELVLSIFTHELITGYLWEAPGVSGASAATVVDVSPLENLVGGAHVKEPPGFCTVPNNGVSVRKYRTSNENISFLISAQGQGGPIRGYGADCEDNVRYYSDGL